MENLKYILKPFRPLKLKHKLTTCRLIVEKHYTIGSLDEIFFRCLQNLPNYECFIGKKFDLDFADLGVVTNNDMTLEELRINSKTIIYFNLID